jgi:hypothetical protein
MAVLDLVVILSGYAPEADGQRLVAALGDALGGHGTEHVLVEWARDGLPGWRPAGRQRYRVAARYTAGFEAALRDRLAAVAPAARVALRWEPHDEERARRAAIDLGVYRVARFLAEGGLDAARGRVARAALADRKPSPGGPPESLQALYDGLGTARGIVGVDWKATRLETVEALGGLRILPGGERPVARLVPDFAAIVADCRRADDADLAGTPASPDDPLRPDGDTMSSSLAAEAVRRRLDSVRLALLYLSNGDTPGYLVAEPDWGDELVRYALAAGVPLARWPDDPYARQEYVPWWR